jgi:hypothetical protein
MKRLFCWASLMALIALTACTTNLLGLDSGLFTGKPCKAPCWNGLTPGVSTAKDVNQFMQDLSTKNWPARDTLVYDTGCKRVMIADQLGSPVKAFVNMNVDKDELTYIQSVHENMPALQQIIAHLGPPEYFRAVHVIGLDGEEYMLTVYYPKQGVVFEVSVDLKDLGFIRPEMVVSGIEYFEPGELLSYFLAQLSCGLGREGAISTAQIQIAQIQPWLGFGEVKVVQTR